MNRVWLIIIPLIAGYLLDLIFGDPRKIPHPVVGFGNMISAGRLIAIVSPDSAPIKRMVQEARERGVLIDASYGRRTRAVLVMDNDHVVLSALQPETVANRLSGEKDTGEEEDE